MAEEANPDRNKGGKKKKRSSVNFTKHLGKDLCLHSPFKIPVGWGLFESQRKFPVQKAGTATNKAFFQDPANQIVLFNQRNPATSNQLGRCFGQ